MTDYTELLARYGDEIYEAPENYLDDLHKALSLTVADNKRLREIIAEVFFAVVKNGTKPEVLRRRMLYWAMNHVDDAPESTIGASYRTTLQEVSDET